MIESSEDGLRGCLTQGGRALSISIPAKLNCKRRAISRTSAEAAGGEASDTPETLLAFAITQNIQMRRGHDSHACL